MLNANRIIMQVVITTLHEPRFFFFKVINNERVKIVSRIIGNLGQVMVLNDQIVIRQTSTENNSKRFYQLLYVYTFSAFRVL